MQKTRKKKNETIERVLEFLHISLPSVVSTRCCKYMESKDSILVYVDRGRVSLQHVLLPSSIA